MGLAMRVSRGGRAVRKPTHPLGLLILARRWDFPQAMAWLEAKGYFTGVIADSQETTVKLRQIPMEVTETILMEADAAWCVPYLEPLEWSYPDEDPFDTWRASLPEGDPRKDPVAYRQHLREHNQHQSNDEPDDAHEKPRNQRRA